MLDEPLAKGSGSMESGCTLAILYAELEDIDITRGTGQVVVKDNSLIYVFGAPLEQVVTHAAHAASVAVKDGDSRLCGHCGDLVPDELTIKPQGGKKGYLSVAGQFFPNFAEAILYEAEIKMT